VCQDISEFADVQSLLLGVVWEAEWCRADLQTSLHRPRYASLWRSWSWLLTCLFKSTLITNFYECWHAADGGDL